MHKLIIIGNGFDLQATLQSSFRDFFEKKEIPLIERWLRNQYDTIIEEISLFSLILYNSFYRKTPSYFPILNPEWNKSFNTTYQSVFSLNEEIIDWKDIEGDIFQILNSKGIQKIESFYNEVRNTGFSKSFNVCPNDQIFEFFGCRKNYIYDINNSFSDFLFKELNLFEKSFSEYLKKEIENNNDYPANSKTIIKELVNDLDRGIILNFNYTKINCDSDNFREINIHGNLSSSIIIGINDEKDLSSNLIRFTKTFRKLWHEETSCVLNHQFDEIIIYGHSLGKQDYSYFQSIFDYSKIYESNTSIVFIYSDNFIGENLNEEKQKLREKMANKLFNLLKTYGSTLNNKDNGQNLIHKLLLEARLRIEKINYIDTEPLKAENEKT